MVPVSGSAYTYAYATLGELVAWIIGWDLIIEYAIGNVAVAISWSGYFQELLRGFGMDLPAWLGTDYRTAAQAAGIRGGDRGRRGGGGGPVAERDARGGGVARRAASRRHSDHLQPARVPDRDARHLRARARHLGERVVQHVDGRAEAGDHRVLRAGRRVLRQAGELDAVRAERIRAAFPAPRRSSSSPTSASTRSRRRRRKRRTRSATCRSA